MIGRRSLSVAVLLLGACSSTHADTPAAPEGAAIPATQPAVSLFDPARHMRTSEVKAGMTGYGLSVFSGTKIERFDVEVVSVLKNQMGPQQDVVLIRCKGQGLEHSGSVAGMSGSPIFLKDEQGRERMIGAFALGWEFAKDPIAGVRPIEEMLRVPTDPRPILGIRQAGAPATWNASTLVTSQFAPASTLVPLAPRSESRDRTALRPLALPLAISGVNDAFIKQIDPLTRASGLQLLQSGGAGDAPVADATARLEPGAAIGIPIVTGDLDLAAIGTVTEVLGDKVFAFGHEFNSEGAVDLPMGVGYIHSIIANTSMSFKLGTLLHTDGAIYSDESVAIAGLIGKKPVMIPMDFTVTTAQRPGEQHFHYDIVRHPRFTPMASGIAISSAVLGHSQFPEEFTIKYTLKLEFDGGRTVEMSNTTTSLAQARELVRDITLPMMLAMENPFERVYLSRVTGKISLESGAHAAVLRTAILEKPAYKPGETVRAFLTTRPWKGQDTTRLIEYKLADDLPEGTYQFTVGDAQRFVMDEARYEGYRFNVEKIEEVFALINSLTKSPSDQLYVRLATQQQGTALGRVALGHLPASRRTVMALPGRPDVTPFVETFVTKIPLDQPLMGSLDLPLIVSRHPEKLVIAEGGPNGSPQQQPQQSPRQGPVQQEEHQD